MALTIASEGSGTSITDNTTLASGATIDAAVGTRLLVCIAAANTGTSGVARTATVADDAASTTNVYTQRGTTGNYTAGVAGDGASQFFFDCTVTTALSSNTITVTFSGNVAQKAMWIYKMTPAGGESALLYEVGTAFAVGGNTVHSANTAVGVPSGYTIFGHAAIETDDALSATDGDSDNGEWSAGETAIADGGNDAASMQTASQVKTTTGTGDQSWQVETTTGRDSARNYIIYYSGVAATGLPAPIRSDGVIPVP